MSLVAAFGVAAALVSPFAWVTVRRVLRERTARRATAAPVEPPARPEGPPDVADVVLAVREQVLEGLDDGAPWVAVRVPDATLGGRPADPAIVDALVLDDLRRRGLTVERTGDGCLRAAR